MNFGFRYQVFDIEYQIFDIEYQTIMFVNKISMFHFEVKKMKIQIFKLDLRLDFLSYLLVNLIGLEWTSVVIQGSVRYLIRHDIW